MPPGVGVVFYDDRSVIGVRNLVKELLEKRARAPAARRERFLLLDFANVDGMDHTTCARQTFAERFCIQ